MRTKEQFKAYVYKKAEEATAKNRISRAVLMRCVTAFSLSLIVGGVLVFGILNGKVSQDALDFTSGSPESVIANQHNDVAENKSVLYSHSLSSSIANDGGFELYDVAAEYGRGGPAYSGLLDTAAAVEREDAETVVKGSLETKVNSPEIALEIAKTSSTVSYDNSTVEYDSATELWKVVFYTENTAGGCQTVYIDLNGTVKEILYGE